MKSRHRNVSMIAIDRITTAETRRQIAEGANDTEVRVYAASWLPKTDSTREAVLTRDAPVLEERLIRTARLLTTDEDAAENALRILFEMEHPGCSWSLTGKDNENNDSEKRREIILANYRNAGDSYVRYLLSGLDKMWSNSERQLDDRIYVISTLYHDCPETRQLLSRVKGKKVCFHNDYLTLCKNEHIDFINDRTIEM